MKILFAPSHYVYDGIKRGSEIAWAFNIVHNIATLYPKSIVITGFKESKEKSNYKIIELQRDKKNIDLSIFNSVLFNYLYTKGIFRHINSVDILHHVLPFGIDKTYNFAFIFKNKNKKYIIGPIQKPVKAHSDNVHDRDINPPSFIKRLIDRTFLLLSQPILKKLSYMTINNADKVIVIDEATKKLLIRNGVNAKHIVIIPPGVDTSKYVPNAQKHSNFTAISSCMLISRKQVDKIIQSIYYAKQSIPDIKLLLLGEGPQRDNLEKLTKKLNLSKNIEFVGLVNNNEISAYYKKADVFLNMSSSEGFATISLEAISSGLPVISTSVGGFSETIHDGKNGFIINDDPELMAKKIVHLYNNPHELQTMKINSRKIAEDTHDWKRVIIKKYIYLYEEVLANHS